MKRGLIVAGLVVLVILIAIGGRMLLSPPQPVRIVTMDGGGEVATINLWDDYTTRGRVTGQARNGEVVRLLRQNGAGCQVETYDQERGWVTCANFIKEFK